MSTTTTTGFNAMLKRYMPYSLLKAEVEKRIYFLNKVNKKTNYKGGTGDIPFKAGHASSFRYGKLVASASITQSKYIMGTMTGYKEIWGAMKFLDHDLNKHDNAAESFIEALLKELPDFAEGMKERVSQALLNGPQLAKVTGITDADEGHIQIDRPEMLEYGMYVEISVGGTIHKTGYVAAIDFNTNDVTIVTAITDVDASTNPVDLTAATTVAVNDILTLEGGSDSTLQFTSIVDQLLSATNGGSATLFGKSKVKYPFLQAYNHSGSAIASANILSTIFDAFGRTKAIAKLGNPSEVLMSYKNLQNAMKELEATGTGVGTGRQFTAGDTKVNAYGWTTIQVTGVKGMVTLVGINELRDDVILGLDWSGIDLHSNGMFERRKSPSGNEYYEERTEDGFVYIVDIRFFGELVVSKPSYQFIIHTISY